MKMIDGEKRWIRRKGCRNAAKQWIVRGTDEDGEEYGQWVVVPMVVGKQFEYVTPQFQLKNIWTDPLTGHFIRTPQPAKAERKYVK